MNIVFKFIYIGIGIGNFVADISVIGILVKTHIGATLIKIFNFPLRLAKALCYFSNFDAFLTFFFRQALLQGCFIECEILQNPMISYQSLIFIATTMNDK